MEMQTPANLGWHKSQTESSQDNMYVCVYVSQPVCLYMRDHLNIQMCVDVSLVHV